MIRSTLRTSEHRIRFHPLLAGLALLVASPSPSSVRAEGLPSAPAASRTALLVFVSYPVPLEFAPDPARVRRGASGVVAAALRERGHDVVTYPELEPTMREWRVRSERDVSFGFLDALVSVFSADQVVIAGVNVYRDRVLFLARGISPVTGRLLWVEGREESRRPEPPSDAAEALSDIVELAKIAARPLVGASTLRRGEGPGAKLVVLPLAPVDVERGPSGLAMSCVFRALLDTGRWTIPDPALVVSALQEEGYDPLLLEDGSRQALASRFGTRAVLVPRLVAFPATIGKAAGPGGPPDEFGVPGDEWRAEEPLLLALVMVDCASGHVVSGGAEYLASEKTYGIFGMGKEVPLARRFQIGADRLVHSLPANDEVGSE